MFSFHFIIGLMVLRCGIEASPPTSSSVAEKDDGLLWKAVRVSQALLGMCLKESSSSALVSSSIGHSRIDYNNVSELMGGCLLRRSVLALDRLRTIDHLQICRGVDLVRYRNDSGLTGSGSSYLRRSYADVENGVDWWKEVMDKLDTLLETRMLKIQMKTDEISLVEEGRRRHHFHQMYPIILFGTLAVTMIAIPMGFQFLAVLGGKALLLAKLALILTSIQGLKKIATSNLSYGLYHTAPQNPCKDYDNLDCQFNDNNYEFRLANDNLQLRLLFEDIVPSINRGHYDRNWYYNSKDDQLQGYREGDGQESTMDLLHPFLSPRNERIK